MRIAVAFLALLAVLSVLIPCAAVGLGGVGLLQLLTLPATSVAAPLPSMTPPQGDDMEDVALPAATTSPPSQAPEEPPAQAVVAPAPTDMTHFAVYDRADGKTLELELEEYLRGAIAAEMPATFHQEALAAQGVAAHSWAVYSARMQRGAQTPDAALHGADFSVDTARCEGYVTRERFFERYGENARLFWPKVCEAAAYARERLLVWQGEAALAAYHSMSAGQTECSENVWQQSLPYLVAVQSEGDLLAPDFEVTETFDQKTLRLLLEQGFEGVVLGDDPACWMEPMAYSASGYVTQVRVGDQTVHGQQLRTALGLRSSCFDIRYRDGTFSVTTQGYGHGVGMSQYGADFMARQGANCEGILQHYYPNAQVVRV